MKHDFYHYIFTDDHKYVESKVMHCGRRALTVINEAAESKEESADDITAAATAAKPIYPTAAGHKYFKQIGKMDAGLGGFSKSK